MASFLALASCTTARAAIEGPEPAPSPIAPQVTLYALTTLHTPTAVQAQTALHAQAAVHVPTAVHAPTAVDAPTTVHVRKNGSAKGDGSADAPFDTIQAGMEALRAGDTLVVHGGSYRERVELRTPAAGTAALPITVMAAPGERVIVKGLLRLHNLRHWVLDAINVTWDDSRNKKDEHMVKFVGGEHWQYRNSEVWNARSYAAVLVAGSPKEFLLQCLHVHDTRRANDLNEDHLIYLNSGRGGGVVERSLLTGSPNGRAIKVGGAYPGDNEVANVVIRFNTMRDNRGPSNVQLAWRTSNVLIERNMMVSPKRGRANITTFELNGSHNVVRDNVGWHSTGVLEATEGLVDGGGNMWINPALGAGAAEAQLERQLSEQFGQSRCPTPVANDLSR